MARFVQRERVDCNVLRPMTTEHRRWKNRERVSMSRSYLTRCVHSLKCQHMCTTSERKKFALNVFFFFRNVRVYIKCVVCEYLSMSARKTKWWCIRMPLCHCNLCWRGFIFLFRLSLSRFFYRILIRPKWRYFIIKYECYNVLCVPLF